MVMGCAAELNTVTDEFPPFRAPIGPGRDSAPI